MGLLRFSEFVATRRVRLLRTVGSIPCYQAYGGQFIKLLSGQPVYVRVC